MATITIDRALLEQALASMVRAELVYGQPNQAIQEAIRAELARPVERVEPITLEQFRAIAHRTATTYRHRSDPEKSSYAFVDGSSLDDFWRKVCEAIQPTSAWHDAPTCDGLWMCNEGDDNPYRWTTHRVTFPLNQLLVGEDERWYGPIQQDTKAEGEST